MSEKEMDILANAINNLAEAVKDLANAIATDEPLNYTLGRGFDEMAKAIACIEK